MGSNASRIDREVWAAFGGQPGEVARLCRRIGEIAADGPAEAADPGDPEGGFVFREGRLLTFQHRRRERPPALRARLVAARREKGPLVCNACGWKCASPDPDMADAGFEAHDLLPLSVSGERPNRISDLALLCATCHRLVRRWIAVKGDWVDAGRIAEEGASWKR